MNDALAAIALGRRIDLTREADFIIGAARVRPTACEVEVAGRRIRLQPRVMQVLIALARAGGEPVSREALIAVCWGSVVVGEDALNRCIQRLRRLAESEVDGAFAIETIPRIGYRLAPRAVPVAGDEAASAPAAAVRPQARRVRPGAWGGVAALALAAMALAAAWVWIARPSHWKIVRSEPLVSTPWLEGSPALSADGTMLAYLAGPEGANRHVWLERIGGGEPIQLVDDPYDDASPAWSPDGSKIAYTTFREGQPCRIMVAPVPAGLPREVGRCVSARVSAITWSLDGEALFYVDSPSRALSWRIVRLALATGRRRDVTDPPGGFDDMNPAVSPDGRWLLYFRRSLQPMRMIIRDLKSGEERVLAHLPQEYDGAAWAEDSKSVFFVGETAQGYGLWSWPIDGGPRDDLIGIGSPLALSQLATGKGGLLAAEIGRGRFEVARPPAAGDTPVVIDPANGVTWSPAFAPDGTLAVASTRSGAGIWLMPPGGRSRMLLGFDHEIPLGLVWSPNGAELAFVALDNRDAGPGSHNSLQVIGLSGDVRARVPLPGAEMGHPAWADDGRSLVIPIRDQIGWRLWRVGVAPAAAPRPFGAYGWMAVRGAGATLYGARKDQPGLWRLAPAPERITAAFTSVNKEAWTVFGKNLVFLDDSDPKHLRLRAAPLAGGPDRPFADLPRADEDANFAIDPLSAKPVYIAALDQDSDIELFHLKRR